MITLSLFSLRVVLQQVEEEEYDNYGSNAPITKSNKKITNNNNSGVKVKQSLLGNNSDR